MARESTRTDNEFRNRQPMKIRQPAKLTTAPGHADNCGLRFKPGAIITKRSPLTIRAHVSFVCSLARETTYRSAHDICLPGKKYSIQFTASFKVNQSTYSCSRVFISIQPDAIHKRPSDKILRNPCVSFSEYASCILLYHATMVASKVSLETNRLL